MKLLTNLEFRLELEQIVRQAAKIALILALAWVGYLLLRRALRAAVEAASARVKEPARRQRITTLLLLANSVLRYGVAILAAVMILEQCHINVGPVLAAAGIVGLAVGFGAQHLVRDVVAGFFIIMEGQYAVGDFVEINGVFGQVEEVGLRTTKIRDPGGQLRYFANGAITSANNYTEEHLAYVVNIPLPGGEEDLVSLVQAALADVDREFGLFAQPPVIGPVTDLPTYAPVLRVEVRVIPGRQGLAEAKLGSRVSAALERAGHPLPAGTEVSLSLRYPPPGAGG